MYLFIYLFIYLLVCIYIFIYLFVYLFMYLFIYLSFYLYIHSSFIYSFTYLFIYFLFIYFYLFIFIHLFYLFVCLFLFVYIPIFWRDDDWTVKVKTVDIILHYVFIWQRTITNNYATLLLEKWIHILIGRIAAIFHTKDVKELCCRL